MGDDTLQEYANKAGFNSGLTIDGIRTKEGKADISGTTWGDLGWAGIGQYSNTANPLNFMAYVGAIANDGVRITRSWSLKGTFGRPYSARASKEKRI